VLVAKRASGNAFHPSTELLYAGPS